MKKVLAAIMMCAFAVTAMAQYWIYDYQVSFKRVDAQYTKVSYSLNVYDGDANYTGYFDSFQTDDDTLAGYIVLPKCSGICNGTWDDFGNVEYAPAKEFEYDAFKLAWNADEEPVEEEPAEVEPQNEFWYNYPVEDEEPEEDIVVRPNDQLADVTIYVKRGDDALYTNPYKSNYAQHTDQFPNGQLVWKFNAWVDAAMFSKGVAIRLEESPCNQRHDELAGKPSSREGLKNAWMVLTYDVPQYIVKGDLDPESENAGSGLRIYPPVANQNIVEDDANVCKVTESVSYGFLGYQCLEGSISQAGFGEVERVYYGEDSETVSFCGSETTQKDSCFVITKINGSIVGEFFYDGFCSISGPMFDICALTAVGTAPISGTWSLILNKDASNAVNNYNGTNSPSYNGKKPASAEQAAEWFALSKLLAAGEFAKITNNGVSYNVYDWSGEAAYDKWFYTFDLKKGYQK